MHRPKYVIMDLAFNRILFYCTKPDCALRFWERENNDPTLLLYKTVDHSTSIRIAWNTDDLEYFVSIYGNINLEYMGFEKLQENRQSVKNIMSELYGI